VRLYTADLSVINDTSVKVHCIIVEYLPTINEKESCRLSLYLKLLGVTVCVLNFYLFNQMFTK